MKKKNENDTFSVLNTMGKIKIVCSSGKKWRAKKNGRGKAGTVNKYTEMENRRKNATTGSNEDECHETSV